MTAHEGPEIDPQHDAASIAGAPQSAAESARARELAELFAPLTHDEQLLSEIDDSAGKEHLAALFADQSTPSTAADEAEPDFSWQPDPVSGAEPSAWAPEPALAAEPQTTPAQSTPDAVPPVTAKPRAARKARAADAAAPVAAAAAVAASNSPSSASADDTAIDELGVDTESADPLAWLDRAERQSTDTPEKAALGSWLGTVGATDSTALPATVAAAAVAEPTQVLPAGAGPAGSFFPAQRRGIRGWSSRVRWSVAVSIVLLIGVVAGAVVIAQTVAANNLAAQQLAAAVDELEGVEVSATQPQSVLDDAVGQYDDMVQTAQATADSAGPPLAAIAGMAAQPLLDASNAALAALNAQLDESTLDDGPELYERGDVDMSDIDEVTAATQTAENHAELVTTATRAVRAAQVALQEKLDALRAAQVALGASLPETAVLIVGENQRALQNFRDAVIAASVAVPAAQNTGGSGDTEMLAYAAAVTALRNDQTRAVTGETRVTPPTTVTPPAPDPVPVPDPVPPPPDPVPEPDPGPSGTPTPTPSP